MTISVGADGARDSLESVCVRDYAEGAMRGVAVHHRVSENNKATDRIAPWTFPVAF
jgi:hypothetical protein